ncbi:MAG: hypothetical protein CSA62_14320 [Planctomycetota bacterium]|nr:MAG: hypothetical protein CSA62_14320 [Planctomycetota bacterium]
MVQRIDKDHTRFRDIVRERIKLNLRQFVGSGEMIGKQGGKYVSVPLPHIQLPCFCFGQNEKGGVGQGEGKEGAAVEVQEGDHEGLGALDVEVEVEELAQILGEELELPNIMPKGNKRSDTTGARMARVSMVAPESLRNFKYTFREVFKGQISAGIYNPDDLVIRQVPTDKRSKSCKPSVLPQANAVIIYMMDVSGSMGQEQKDMVRIESFWIDAWLRSQYKNLEVQYIVHDAVAHLVDQHTFFHLREYGGTKISSAYELLVQLMEKRYPAQEWNIYPFHFSDGDNWSSSDTEHCIGLLKERVLPFVNQFGYGQVKSAYGSGQFKKDLDHVFHDDARIVTSNIFDRKSIPDSVKEFLGRGK